MPERRTVLGYLGVGALAAAAGAVLSPRLGDPSPVEELRSTRFTDLAGKSRNLQEWKDQVLVVNFWATWCAPCRQEIPDLLRVRNKLHASGVEFVGIAIDQVAKVTEFALILQISYPVLIADASGLKLVRALGNPSGGLPFTIVLDRKGEVVHRNVGPVTQYQIEKQVQAALVA